MKKYIYIMLSVVLAGLMSSCSKDTPFDNDSDVAYGRLLTSALDVSLNSEYGPRSLKNRKVRAAAPAVANFTVAFYREGSETPERTYLYKDMPEIVTLPVGQYRAVASYGDNKDAAWEEPYYAGETSFEIEADKITDEVSPIKCVFANVRVSVNFSDDLRDAMGSDCKVAVKVGESGYLDFTINDVERSGYFRYVENSHTLAAEFSGTVDGVQSHEVRTYTDVNPGTHYAITFTLRDAGEEDPGWITPHPDNDGSLVDIDATVDIEDMNGNVDSGEDVIKDDMRPQEGEDEDPGKEEPTPDVPDQPQGDGPTIGFPAGSTLSFDKENEINVDDNGDSAVDVELVIKSSDPAGITGFMVYITSNILTKEVLEQVSLSDELDLIHPGSMESMLKDDLGFPVGNDVEGQNEVVFSVTKFIPMLINVADQTGHHEFKLVVTDAQGTTTRILKLVNYK